MAMASPAIGQCPYPLLLDKEQQLFLQSLSANERKKILKRSASGDMKQWKRQTPAQQPPAAGAAAGAMPQQRGTEQGSGLAAPPGKAGGGWGPEEGERPRGEAGGGRLLGTAEDPGPGRTAPAQQDAGPSAVPQSREPFAGSSGAGEEVELAGCSPQDPPASPGLGKPPRSGLLHLRLRLRSGAPRQLPDVRTIFEQPRDPRVREEKGEGHRFEVFALGRGWCDLCGEAVQQRALRCTNCKYTCHQECRSLIQLDCSQQGQPQNKPSPENTLTHNCSQNVTKAVAEEKPKAPTTQEIEQIINSYNAKVTNCFVMKLNEDGTYTGFIKVHLKLRRPVTVPAGIRPQSIYDALKEVNLADMTDKRTSFYLPLDAVKQLHISSTTTVSEVIQGLLKKFMVVDNPQKFALFKEMQRDGQVLFQKLSLTEYPLYLRLLAGPDTDVLSFVLKENETGEVEWDAFSIPELQNFLMILDREEKDKIQQVQKKYSKFKQRLEETLKEAGGKPG
ncbi:ras association domain-containing protein 5 isoform X1 [Malaclemys terrapin pileata]|uniref:ras association domain-containing protein 5 isoform X1 n=2 Tax=Malaclemys terrapin pileata TaxID=2991368 RepID=UPI0023A8D2F6|nr:ras association domain-containing protein 5 isoform X1 [Malaclemys terrapin pileata]